MLLEMVEARLHAAGFQTHARAEVGPRSEMLGRVADGPGQRILVRPRRRWRNTLILLYFKPEIVYNVCICG